MSELRAYAALTAVPALLTFGSGTVAAQPVDGPASTVGSVATDVMVTAAADSDRLRVGSENFQLPEGIDPRLREQVQSYVDGVQEQIVAAYDGIGFSSNEADRRNASTVAGGIIGAVIGKVVVFPLEIVGCAVGATVGAVAGGVIGGLPTVGAGVPVGAAVGGVAGCLIGGLAVAIPVDVIGLVGGAAIGGAIGGALGSGVDAAPVEASLPMASIQAPQYDPLATEPIAAAVALVSVSPDTHPAVSSLRTAIDAMPPLTPDALGPLTQPANDLLAAVQAAF